jgi:tRNA-modifying protein YgfZ
LLNAEKHPMTEGWPGILSSRGALIDAAGHVHFTPSPAPSTAGIVPLLQEASILVRGEDAGSFLQGQLSNDIDQLSAARGQPAAYCTPKGRVLATLSIWPHSAGYVLRLPVGLAEPIRKRLQIYVLRSRVWLEDISHEVALLGLVGAQSVPLLRKEFATAPQTPFSVVHSKAGMAMALPGERVELAMAPTDAASVWDRLIAAGCFPAGQHLWDSAAIAVGLPTILPATSDLFIPQMLNLEQTGAISFDKGCYPGQEVVARSQYRGEVKRRLYRFCASQPAPPGTSVHTSEGDVAGTVVNSVEARNGEFELLAVVSTQAAAAPLYLDGTRTSALQPRALPYDVPGNQTDAD